jgi:ubiquinone/menaquinone biosynthesis C-methylase UbiE
MSMKPSLYWNLEEDKGNIREGAIELRARVAEHMYFKNYETPEKAKQQLNGPGFTWRIAAARKVELITGKKLSGRIIEVGAGTGVFSAQISKEPQVIEVYCLDYDRFSVDSLFPLVCTNLGAVTDKIQPVVGSYNSMKTEDGYFDYVISLGAIHHSENLTATLKECYRVLKPGGFVVAVEHCHPNSYTNYQQQADYERLISPQRAKMLYNDENLKIKVKDNSDHYYRICEFESAGFAAGFDVLPYIFDIEGEKADDRIFTKPQPYRDYSNRFFKPYFAKDVAKPVFDNLLLILHKPHSDNAPSFMSDINVKNISEKGFFGRLFK